jgi:hypothetical protein
MYDYENHIFVALLFILANLVGENTNTYTNNKGYPETIQ